MGNSKSAKIIQFPLDFDKQKWPDQENFPLNIPDLGRKVGQILERDLRESHECLIVTGFTSLSRIIEWFGTDKFSNLRSIRILLGNDPILRKRNKYPFNFIDIGIKEYWLNKGISLYLGSSVLNLINKLETGNICIKFKKRSHAKIYIGKNNAILGSSNFSKSGLEQQIEANIRQSKDDQYVEIKRLGELIYDEGTNYNAEIISLLKELLADVTWEEALARAIAEVLEGKWFSLHNEFFDRLSIKRFWPTQYSGLIEAINILIDKGNVLIADPTGSGKTKMCSAIIISFVYWLWQIGERFKTNLLLFSPPLVQSNWESEFRELDFLNYTIRSVGILSNTTEDNLKNILAELSLANLLVVDEAHNLLNPISKRSRKIASNRAEYKILITATPVNKKLEDLIRIIELLDVDNLSDTDFNLYKEIKESKERIVDTEKRERLKGFIDNFLVRRTKTELNEIIDRNPAEYENKAGKRCRFPEVENPVYVTRETTDDKNIAKQISNLAKKLKGVNYLRNFVPPEYLVRNENDKKNYIKQRVEGAKNLAIYNIRACLRSSKVALLEYLEGTDKVNGEYELESNKDSTGKVIGIISNLINTLPERNFDSIHFPHWLIDPDEYNKTCEEEISIYQQILSLVNELSSEREIGKVDEIIKLLESHDVVIAFDSKLISLDYLNKLLTSRNLGVRSYIATGSNKSVVEKVLKICAPDSKYTNTVIFCSDKMSEGVNLQKASALILLDLPSVIRLVEQRIGRIDRMDTEHKTIKVLWPNDSDEYSLKGDSRLIKTASFVNATIGGNFEIPNELKDKHFENVDNIESIKEELEAKKGERGWEGTHNFFKPIQTLKDKFIEDDLYKMIKDVKAQVKTKVSFYRSDKSWCFICTRGDMKESPKWLFLEHRQQPLYNFVQVSSKLNGVLESIDERLEWDQDILDSFLKEFRSYERFLLPEKKRRTLEVAEFILRMRRDNVKKSQESGIKSLLNKNLSLFNSSIKDEITDFNSLAEIWLNILQPYLDKKKNKPRLRRKALNLNSLKEYWKQIQFTPADLQKILDNCHKTDSIDNKIAACIIGVSNDK